MLYCKLLLKEMKHRLRVFIISAVAFVIMFHINGYVVGKLEYLYVLLALISCTTILSEDEIDFLVIGHIQLPKVFILRFIASVLTVTTIPFIWVLVFTNENRPIKAAFSLIVTIIIIAAIGAFFRAVLKNTLLAIISSLFVFTCFLISAEFGLFSPFGSMSIANIKLFYLNRCVWLSISAILIIVSYFILLSKNKLSVLKKKLKI